MYLGAHIGISDGLAEAAREARRIGAESIQIFSKSPQMWAGPPVSAEAADAFRSAVRAEGLRAAAVHQGYLPNLASPKPGPLERSRLALLDEIRRAELLGVDGLIFHPGAHLGSGVDTGLKTISESLTWALEQVPDGRVRLLIENAAGQGTALCSTFEEIARVLADTAAPGRLGVALDTCHLFASGQDFRTPEGYERIAREIDGVLGRENVRAFHLNDARAPLGSHLDRHENIGVGEIGRPGFTQLLNDARWAEVPGYLETPLDGEGYDRYARDLATLRTYLKTGGRARPRRKPPSRSDRAASTVK